MLAGPGGVDDGANSVLVSSHNDRNGLLRMDTDDGKSSVCVASDRPLQQARCFLPQRHLAIVMAIFVSLGLTAVALLACPWSQHGNIFFRSAAGATVSMVLTTSTDACGVVDKDFEYHTEASLKVLANVNNAGMCCAECRKHPQCRVWIYGMVETVVGDGLQSLARNCHLRAFNDGEHLKKIPRPGVTSGNLNVKTAEAAPNISNHGSDRRHVIRERFFEEVSEDNVEWQVVSLIAPVLLRPGMQKAMRIGEKWRGDVLVGRRVGSQVHLAHDFGFVPIEDANGTTYLTKRTVRYRKILSGSCADSDMIPINDAVVCSAAVAALGYFDPHVALSNAGGPAPEGCFIHAGQVWLSPADSNRGRGALGSSWPICSSGAYPTTTSTVTTTTSTTMTTTNKTHWGYPSLFCFQVVSTTSFELSLVRHQQSRRVSIFACDESLTFSDGKEPQELGHDDDGLTINTVEAAALTSGHSQPDENKGVWPTTEDFLEVWSYLHRDGRVSNHDWTAKVDPAAVFFPDRLRIQLEAHTHQPDWSLYVANCNQVSPPGLYGPLEAFSRAALRTFFHDGHKCRANLQWQDWAEANFMSHCMDMLGVGRVFADNLLSDKRCTYSPCSDGTKAAYYNYSDASPTGAWFSCWHESAGDFLPPVQ